MLKWNSWCVNHEAQLILQSHNRRLLKLEINIICIKIKLFFLEKNRYFDFLIKDNKSNFILKN